MKYCERIQWELIEEKTNPFLWERDIFLEKATTQIRCNGEVARKEGVSISTF